jgi:acyl-CoA synthetase (AMP-forming)/AMP-acid ligase II
VRGRPVSIPTEKSIVEILDARAAQDADRRIFTFLDDAGSEIEWMSYGQLRARGEAIAARLQDWLAPGDRALLIYPPGLECIAALFGCFYAGVIAVPVCPPRPELLEAGTAPLLRIAVDCAPAALLTSGTITETIRRLHDRRPELASAGLIVTDEIDAAEASRVQRRRIDRGDVAVLQYTSGATGDPKGVIVTHGNILANEFTIQRAFHHYTGSRPGEGVCWLPFHHDMCLIGSVLQAVYVDGPMHIMSPVTLLQRPFQWLKAIDHYRAHTSGGPNFAYDLCVRRITDEQKAELDLSSWEVAAIGAEPVSAATMRRFTEAFAVCGFRPEAFFPCYGLAEATLFVSGGDKEAAPVVWSFADSEDATTANVRGAGCGLRDAVSERPLVSCGHAWPEDEMRIVDPERQVECAEGEIGEIWFRGPSLAAGYWERPDESEAVFQARLAGSGEEPFLRTGDLGFVWDGELFVCGRLKDLIVIHGRNIYPQDIEDTVAETHEGFVPGRGAAFGRQFEEEERLVVVQEIDRTSRSLDLEALTRDVRRRVAESHQVQLHDIVYVRRGSLPVTTSGKVRRRETHDRYAANELVLWRPRRSS